MRNGLRRTNTAEVLVNDIAKQLTAAGMSTELRRGPKGGKSFNVDDLAALSLSLNLPVAEMLDRAGVK